MNYHNLSSSFTINAGLFTAGSSFGETFRSSVTIEKIYLSVLCNDQTTSQNLDGKTVFNISPGTGSSRSISVRIPGLSNFQRNFSVQLSHNDSFVCDYEFLGMSGDAIAFGFNTYLNTAAVNNSTVTVFITLGYILN